MGNSSLCKTRDYLNMAVEPRRMHLLDKPSGYASTLAKNSLAHQMRYSVSVLEKELLDAGNPHVLQLQLTGKDERTPSSWELFADGTVVASGTGEFARECFYKSATVFLEVCRGAVFAAELPQWSEQEYKLLCAARKIASVA